MATPAITGFGEIRIETLGLSASKVRGSIVNISQGAIHVRVSQFVSSDSVRVWFSEDCQRDGKLIFCRAEENTYRVGIHFPPDAQYSQRSELRIPLLEQPAIVSELEGRTQARYDAQVVDISRSGLGLLVNVRLAVNTWVKVELTFAIAFGEVMYSKAEVHGGYRVGLRVETLLMRDGRSDFDAGILQHPLLCELASGVSCADAA
jgi:PilZ domain